MKHRSPCFFMPGIARVFFRGPALNWALPLVFTVSAHCVARAADSDDVVAVYSAVSPAYKRERAPDGTPMPQTYAFGEGGNQGGVKADLSADQLKFSDIVQIVAPALAAQHFVPCDTKDPRHTDLLVIVYWGTTIGTDGTASSAEYQTAQSLIPPPMGTPPPPPDGQGGTAMVSDPNTSGRREEGEVRAVEKAANDSALQLSLTMNQMANRQRDRQNLQNATILGFTPELQRVQGYASTALRYRRQDVIDEVEETRYYVVLMAYDFQSLWLHKTKKILWETRFSIPERRHDFTKDLPAMVESASRYFGKNSDGLVRALPREGKVEIGEMKSLGPVK